MEYFINSLNLSSNPRVDSGFMPETVSGVNWRLNIDQVRITSTTIKLPVIFTAVNFEAQRYFTYDHTGDTELGINKWQIL